MAKLSANGSIMWSIRIENGDYVKQFRLMESGWILRKVNWKDGGTNTWKRAFTIKPTTEQAQKFLEEALAKGYKKEVVR